GCDNPLGKKVGQRLAAHPGDQHPLKGGAGVIQPCLTRLIQQWNLGKPGHPHIRSGETLRLPAVLCTENKHWTAGSAKSDAKPYPAWELSRSNTAIGRPAGTTSSTGLAGARTTLGSASSGSPGPPGHPARSGHPPPTS